MSSTAIATVVKMMESLPEPMQNQVLEHLREYLADAQDELQWDGQFARTQERLIAAARRARKEIAQQNPFHPSLRFKCINRQENLWSARVSLGLRVLGVLEGDTVTWFWIGGHDEYDRSL